MTRSHNTAPNPTGHNTEPHAEDPFDTVNAADFLQSQNARFTAAQEVLEQRGDTTQFEGEEEFARLVGALVSNDPELEHLSFDDKMALIYGASAAMENAARALISNDKLAAHYPAQVDKLADDPNAIIKHEMSIQRNHLRSHNKDIFERLDRDARSADPQFSTSDVSSQLANVKDNRAAIFGFDRTAGQVDKDGSPVAAGKLDKDGSPSPSMYLYELRARATDPENSALTDKELQDARVDMRAEILQNLMAAQAYLRIANRKNPDDPNGGLLFRNENTGINAKQLKSELDAMMRRGGMMDFVTDIVRDNTPEGQEPPVSDNGQDHDYDDAPDPASVPPAPSTPPATPNAPVFSRAETDRLRGIAEKDRRAAVESEYTAAKIALAKASATRTSATAAVFGTSEAQEEESARLHDRFSAAIYEKMKQDPDYQTVLTNPDLTMEERGAMINAYYMRCNEEMRSVSVDAMADQWANKGAEFYQNHQTMIKVGIYMLGVFTGGLHGVILARAITKGLDVASDRQLKNLESQRNAEHIGGVGGVVVGADSVGATISGQESLDAVLAEIEKNGEFTPENMRAIALAAGSNLSAQYEKKFVEAYKKINRNRAIGSVAAGAAVGGINYVLGEMAYGYIDYQLHGSGGWNDLWNHWDNADGDTPFKATVDKPWFVDNLGVILLGAGAAAAGAVAAKGAKVKLDDKARARANREEDERIRRAAQAAAAQQAQSQNTPVGANS